MLNYIVFLYRFISRFFCTEIGTTVVLVGTAFAKVDNTGLSVLSMLSICIFFTTVVGILVEVYIAVRIILLFEVCIASIVGYTTSLLPYVGSIAVILVIVFLVIAAVESILLFGFVILLHYLDQISNLHKLRNLQS